MSEAPLSYGQLHAWRTMEGIPPQLRYEANLGESWDLPPGTSRDRVHTVLRVLVARHESLRTVYRDVDGAVPGQTVLEELPDLPVEHVAVSGESVRAPADLMGERRRRTFDPCAEPAWRAVVQETAGGPARVLFVGHHLTVDGWALDLLSREFGLLLREGTDGLAGGVLQPRTLAEEQRSPAGEGRRSAAAGYRRRLFDALSTADLRALPASAGKGGQRTNAMFEVPLHADHVRPVCERLEITPQSLLLACWGLCLHSILGIERSAVNLVAANRVSPALRSLVSSTTQIVPLLVETDRAAEFAAYARTLDARARRAYSLASYDVDDYARERAAAATAHGLPDVRFSCGFNFRADTPSTTAPAEIPRDEGRFSLAKPRDAGPTLLTDVRLGDSLSMVSVCDPAVLTPDETEALCRSFGAAVRAVVEKPASTLQQLGPAV
ncbi:condensation domain-containing protein [Streptomyces sulphureus]|uniref:condensation domain-containing protein n=1 Tax=Streptomyces sulphureus TaxID=47758 RepID=UPI000378697A|nr:condensation domain-containing protein [Streptomyces sulphureus]